MTNDKVATGNQDRKRENETNFSFIINSRDRLLSIEIVR